MSGKLYNHAYSLGFQVISRKENGSDVNAEMLLSALLRRIHSIHASGEIVDACDSPWDVHETNFEDEQNIAAVHAGDDFKHVMRRVPK